MQAVILAGGRGTRLKSITGDLPKPLVEIFDATGKSHPLLVHQLELARSQGIFDILILTGYRSEAIRDAIGHGSRFGVRVSYQDESESDPLGAAGALLAAYPLLEDRFVLFYGDCYMQVGLQRILDTHEKHAAEATLFVHPNDHPHDSDLVSADATGWIEAFHPSPHAADQWLPNLVNAALHVFEKAALTAYRDAWLTGSIPRKLDLGKHLFPMMLADGHRLYAYRCSEYIKDAGTPGRLEKVTHDIQSGRVFSDSLANKQKAIFLDRDGTLNVEVERVRTPDDFNLIEGTGESVRLINSAGYRAIVISNQAVLARGDCDEPTLRQVHAKMETLLGRDGAWLDAIYYCPHHPHRGYPGEVAALKIECDCRKPAIGLLLKAQNDFNVDLSQSWMIGDSSVDIRTAKNAGLRSILIQTGKAGADGQYPDRPDYVFATLLDAVSFIVKHHSFPENTHPKP
jgi:D,D-heptose 1,7-bisphosphate phosphatase